MKEEKRKVRPFPWPKEKDFSNVYMHGGLIRYAPSLNREIDQYHLEIFNIHQAIDQSSGCLIIFGNPGAGKSFLMHYLSYRVLFPDDKKVDPTMRLIGGRQPDAWFPLIVNLDDGNVNKKIKEFFDVEGKESADRADNFSRWLLSVTLFQEKFSNFEWLGRHRWFYEWLKQEVFQNALVILDGIEQIADGGTSIEDSFMQAMNDFCEKYCFGDLERPCLLVATSRYRGNSILPKDHWTYWELSPLALSKRQKVGFLSRILTDDVDKNSSSARGGGHPLDVDKIAAELSSTPRIADFTANPLILSIYAFLHTHGTDTNEFSYSALYEKLVEETWTRAKHDSSQKPQPETQANEKNNIGSIKLGTVKFMLGCLAYETLMKGGNTRLVISDDKLMEGIRKAASEKEKRELASDEMEEIRRHITDDSRAALLTSLSQPMITLVDRWVARFLGLTFTYRDEGYVFRHITMQEYFAYFYLQEPEAAPNQAMLCHWLSDPWWQGVFILYLSETSTALSIIKGILLPFYMGEVISPNTDSLQMAERSLAILETQAAAHTVLTIPPPLQIEVEDKREEVDKLKKNKIGLRKGSLSSEIKLRMLFTLLQGLHGHINNPRLSVQQDLKTSSAYKEVRCDIVKKLLELLNSESDLNWQLVPQVASVGLGELLTSEDWQEIKSLLDSNKPKVCGNAMMFCEKIGGINSVNFLLPFLGSTDQNLQRVAIRALQSLITQAETEVYKVVDAPAYSMQMRRNAIRVFSASRNIEYLDKLIELGVVHADLRQELKQTVVNIAYDHRDYLNSKLWTYLLKKDNDLNRQFVFDALVEAQEKVMIALTYHLTDFIGKFKLQYIIIDIFSSQGRMYMDFNQIKPSYCSMLATLLFSKIRDHVRFALRILHGTQQVWIVDLVEKLYMQALPAERRRLRIHLMKLQKKDSEEDYAPLITDLLAAFRRCRLAALRKRLFGGSSSV